ncbi:MAG: methionyl-tRNA formyltransferase [Phycisphaerales bacterium]
MTSAQRPARVLFFGSGAFGVPTLRAVSTTHRVVGVVSQPDRPAGRGGALTPTPVSQEVLAGAAGLGGVELIRCEDVNAPADRERIRAIDADVWLVIAFGQKLSPELLGGEAGRPAINLHASLLPRWRGAAPINAAILAGDARTGNSVITLAERMDAGLVLGQSERAIETSMTAGELHDLLADDGPALVGRVIDSIMTRGVEGQRQDEALVTRARKLSRADAWVDFGATAEECRRRINGLSPWPGVTAGLLGKHLKLVRADTQKTEGEPREPGRFADPSTGAVWCGDGAICRILEVQPAGGVVMSWAEFARGGGRKVDGSMKLEAGRPTC